MHYSLFIKNVIPLSQNSRHARNAGITLFTQYQAFLQTEFNQKYPAIRPLTQPLYAKVFYIHKRNDGSYSQRDADNMSKPLWDALNNFIYRDDKQIKHREAAKLASTDNTFLDINVTGLSDPDYGDFLDFCLNAANPYDKLLYIEIGDFDHRRVKLGE